MVNRKLVVGALSMALVLSSPGAVSQVTKVDVLWSGLFRHFTTPPVPGEPDIKLPHGYIGPRPVRQTDRVPGRVGALFGVLFVPRGQGPSFVVMRKVNHFPEPGMPEAKTATRMLTSEYKFDCLLNSPCFAGYRFDNENEIVPGQWRFEVFSGDTKLLETEFVVERDRAKPSV